MYILIYPLGLMEHGTGKSLLQLPWLIRQRNGRAAEHGKYHKWTMAMTQEMLPDIAIGNSMDWMQDIPTNNLKNLRGFVLVDTMTMAHLSGPGETQILVLMIGYSCDQHGSTPSRGLVQHPPVPSFDGRNSGSSSNWLSNLWLRGTGCSTIWPLLDLLLHKLSV